MRPVTVSIDVPQTPEEVYDFLDVMAHHERFTNHYLKNWRCEGPARGVGSRATVTAALAGTKADVDIEVVEAEAPRRIVERNISAGGRRRAHGTYTVESLGTGGGSGGGGGSRVAFTYSWTSAPLADRLFAPFVRATMRRANRTAMHRLATELTRHTSTTDS